MVVYYNVVNIPRQDYRIISEIEKNGQWTGKKLVEHSMYPWKNVQPDREVSAYLIEGEDRKQFWVDAHTLLMGISHHSISITNARITGGRIQYDPRR